MTAAPFPVDLAERIAAAGTLAELEALWPYALQHENTRALYHGRKFYLTDGRRPVGPVFQAAARPAPAQPPERPVRTRGMEPAEMQAIAKMHGEQATWRTLADVSDDPPGDLLFGMLEQGPTLGYAAPGTGKGVTGAYLCVEAQKAGMLPMVYDAEQRPREWSRRVSGLGGDRSRVVYGGPGDLPPAIAGRPLWETAPYLGGIAKQAGVDLLIVDSIMPAVGLGEDRLKSDAQVPYLYVAALDALGIPSLSFAHPPKGQPEGEAYGSYAWTAAMRLTWLATKAEGDGHRVRWRPRKRNERGHIPGFVLTFTYGDDGRPCAVEREDDEETTREAILAALAHGPRSVSELTEEVLDEIEDPPPGEADRVRERLGRALRRMSKEGWIERNGKPGSHNATWSLRVRDVSGEEMRTQGAGYVR